jgi:hypothetical protein
MEKIKKTNRLWRILALSLLGIVIIIIVGFTIWASLPLEPESSALEDLSSNSNLRFEVINQWLVFTPIGLQPKTGLILYPGARVDFRAYAPHAKAIAEAGFMVIVPKMPLNFAFFGVNRAEAIIEAFPGIQTWVVGGHSLGGAMAAQFAGSNPEVVDGLVLWGAYPGESTDLSTAALSAIAIFASKDGLVSLKEVDESRDNLPPGTIYLEIQGGNHAGFGWYGAQNGDGQAEITKLDQQTQIVEATVRFLQFLEDGE